MNRLTNMSFKELCKNFPIEEGYEKREDKNGNYILVPYKEIMVAQYEMPDLNEMKNIDDVIKPHKVEMRIRVYERD